MRRWQTLREIIARMPDSLDRSDRFFDNTDRIMRESDCTCQHERRLPAFATTSAQIEQIRSEMDGVIGSEGALVKFSEEARSDQGSRLSDGDPISTRGGG